MSGLLIILQRILVLISEKLFLPNSAVSLKLVGKPTFSKGKGNESSYRSFRHAYDNLPQEINFTLWKGSLCNCQGIAP